MENKGLVKLIKVQYNDKNYQGAIKLLDKYFSDKDAGVFDWILDIYINCQLYLGLIKDAGKNLDIMVKIYPEYYNKFELALMYIRCGKMKELMNLLLNHNFSSTNYYYIAKTCFYHGKHEQAKQLFNVFIARSDKEYLVKSAREYLRKMEAYKLSKDVFIEMDYSHFKSIGETIMTGHVVYVEQLKSKYEENAINTDPLKDSRPYMIWKIMDEKIYAFPVASAKKDKDRYVLYHQNYNCCNFDRRVKDRLVCIEEKDIEKVIDKINPKDYKIIIENLYYSTCFCDDPLKKESRFFMNTFARSFDVKQHDVIRLHDPVEKVRKLYFILDVDENYELYKVIEVNRIDEGTFELKESQVTNIKIGTPILNIVRVSEAEKNRLVEIVYNKANDDEKTYKMKYTC